MQLRGWGLSLEIVEMNFDRNSRDEWERVSFKLKRGTLSVYLFLQVQDHFLHLFPTWKPSFLFEYFIIRRMWILWQYVIIFLFWQLAMVLCIFSEVHKTSSCQVVLSFINVLNSWGGRPLFVPCVKFLVGERGDHLLVWYWECRNVSWERITRSKTGILLPVHPTVHEGILL